MTNCHKENIRRLEVKICNCKGFGCFTCLNLVWGKKKKAGSENVNSIMKKHKVFTVI